VETVRSTVIAMGIGLGMGSIAHSLPSQPTEGMKETKNALERATSSVNVDYGKLPLYFIRNHGQVGEKAKFYERGRGHATYFAKDGVYLTLQNNSPSDPNYKEVKFGTFDQKSKKKGFGSALAKLSILDGNKNPNIVGEGLQQGKVNYFIGNDPGKWKSSIPTYQAVVYKEVYPGIDIKFYGNNCQLEYDIVVKPGAEPSKVKFAYEGIEELRVTEDGDLEIGLKGGKILQKKPTVFQDIDGKRMEVEGKFKLLGKQIIDGDERDESNLHFKFAYGFEVAFYEKNHPLIIDPVLVYSTFLGGNGEDNGFSIAVDAAGNAYLAGTTSSLDFPTASPFQEVLEGGRSGDAFVTKLNAAGSALVYSTYLGGSDGASGHGIAVDAAGNAYITGHTSSLDFPTANPFQAISGDGSDTFVTKLNAAGSALVYSTYLGGSDIDISQGIAVDASGIAYVTGTSISGPIGLVHVAKLNAAGSVLVSFVFGGNGFEGSNGIALDSFENAFLTGVTISDLFPTESPLQPTHGGGLSDAFVVKISFLTNPQVRNISSRTFVGTGDNVGIGGFIIGGAISKTVLIRGRGPSMSGAPFNLPGTLSNPFMQLYSFASGTFIAQNDNWQVTDLLCANSGYTCGTPAEITATGLDPCIPNPGQPGAPPGCANESAVLITLPPGQYGAIMSGVNNGTGVGLVEVFDLDDVTL